MLTAVVNIAVFAAFSPRVEGVLRSNAAFKPVCGLRPLDVSRYGWQKRQETATNRQDVARSGKVGGTNGNVVTDAGHIPARSMPPRPRPQSGKTGGFGAICGCSGTCGVGWRRRYRTKI